MNIELVVKGCEAHRDAADLHRLQHREGVDCTRPADVHLDIQQTRRRLTRRELEGNCPPRLPSDGAKLLLAQKGRFQPLADLGVVNLADPAVLANFAQTMARKYPARKYALFLGDHGSAWPGVCFDDSHDEEGLTLPRLSAALRIVTSQQQLLAEQEALRLQATHDPLTGLWNRAVILEVLERELARSRREGTALGVLMADLDYFKHVNDTHGHPAGDRVLREAAQRMLAAFRPYDTIGRYGGEEFAILINDLQESQVVRLVTRVRTAWTPIPALIEANNCGSQPNWSCREITHRPGKHSSDPNER